MLVGVKLRTHVVPAPSTRGRELPPVIREVASRAGVHPDSGRKGTIDGHFLQQRGRDHR
jgi:hypothetical protein